MLSNPALQYKVLDASTASFYNWRLDNKSRRKWAIVYEDFEDNIRRALPGFWFCLYFWHQRINESATGGVSGSTFSGCVAERGIHHAFSCEDYLVGPPAAVHQDPPAGSGYSTAFLPCDVRCLLDGACRCTSFLPDTKQTRGTWNFGFIKEPPAKPGTLI